MKKLLGGLATIAATGALAATAQALPHSQATGLSHRDACGVAGEGAARCDAKVVTKDGKTFGSNVTDPPVAQIAGYHPSDLWAAYKLPGLGATSTSTVAIVDAYDDPNAASDLAAYRSKFGLPACGSGCFTKIDQNGGSSYPAANSGWAEEISLDLDMVSSACPSCHILLVEAASNSFTNLMTAVRTAKNSAGVVAVSNSYGGSEFSGESTYDSNFAQPSGKAVAFTVSSGDSGYGTEYPAASPSVTATGGTSLSTSSSTRGWTESAWSGAGSGCSVYESAKPTWQTDRTTCARRTIADVSSVADPNTGVSVYDTYGGDPGWMVFGGTSAAAPLIGAVFAQNMTRTTAPASWPYANTASLFDVTSGSNGRCTSRRNTSNAYLCTARAGYDGPTGLGTPNGIAAF